MSEWLLDPDNYDQIAECYGTPHPPPRIRIPFTQPCAPIRRSYVIGNPILLGESFDSYLFQGFSGWVFYQPGGVMQEAVFQPSHPSAFTEDVQIQIHSTPYLPSPHASYWVQIKNLLWKLCCMWSSTGTHQDFVSWGGMMSGFHIIPIIFLLSPMPSIPLVSLFNFYLWICSLWSHNKCPECSCSHTGAVLLQLVLWETQCTSWVCT